MLRNCVYSLLVLLKYKWCMASEMSKNENILYNTLWNLLVDSDFIYKFIFEIDKLNNFVKQFWDFGSQVFYGCPV